MATYTSWQRTIVDESGDVIPGATVEVRSESTGNIVSIFSGPSGGALANPFPAGLDGFARFYGGAGLYKIRASDGAFFKEWRNVALGTLQALDAGPADSQVQANSENRGEFRAKDREIIEVSGSSYTVSGLDRDVLIRTTSDSAVTITLPEDATQALPDGFRFLVEKVGLGDVSFVVEGGDVLESADSIDTITVRYSAMPVVKVESGLWWLNVYSEIAQQAAISADADADRAEAAAASVSGVPVLLETVNITAVANIDLPAVFSDNPGYEYYRVVIDAADWFGGVGFYMLLSVDGSTFSTTASDYDPASSRGVGIGEVSSDSRVWADVLFINSGSSTGVTSIQGRGSSIDGTTVLHENIQSAFVGSEDAITGFRLRGDGTGEFVAGGSVKVYGSQAPF